MLCGCVHDNIIVPCQFLDLDGALTTRRHRQEPENNRSNRVKSRQLLFPIVLCQPMLTVAVATALALESLVMEFGLMGGKPIFCILRKINHAYPFSRP